MLIRRGFLRNELQMSTEMTRKRSDKTEPVPSSRIRTTPDTETAPNKVAGIK